MLNQLNNLGFIHTPIFDFVDSVENHPSLKRGILKFPFQWKGWQSRNEIDGVGLITLFISKIATNLNSSTSLFNEQKPTAEKKTETKSDVSLPFKVLLYNDDWHTFDEVIVQLIKALRCSVNKAKSFAFEAHVKGSTVIYTGELSQCLKITSVLEEIGLNTEIISD